MRTAPAASSLGSPLPGAAARAEECVALDNFSQGRSASFPPDWKPRKDAGRGRCTRSRRKDGPALPPRASPRASASRPAKQYAWDLEAYPDPRLVVAARRVSQGLRRAAVEDQRQRGVRLRRLSQLAWFGQDAQVRLERGGARGHAPHLERGVHPGAGAAERRGGQGQWTEERVNVLEDYQKFFGESDTPRPAASRCSPTPTTPRARPGRLRELPRLQALRRVTSEPDRIPSRLSSSAGSPTGCRWFRPPASGWPPWSRRSGARGG